MQRFFLLTLIGMLVLPAEAAVYRCEQSDGTVIYTDNPCDGGKPMKLPRLPTYTPRIPTPPPSQPVRPKQAESGYDEITIQSPVHDATIRHDTGQVIVQVTVNPNLKAGHLIILAVDGQELGKPEFTTSFQLSNVDRGAHRLEAIVVTDKGSEVGRSPASTFHMHRFSALHPQQQKLKKQKEQQEKQQSPEPDAP